MRFGKVLKKVRNEHKHSLRTLAEKTGIYFTYIDKIEKSEKPINNEILEKLVKEYPLDKKELINAYIAETIPGFVLKEIKTPIKKTGNIIADMYNTLFEGFGIEEQKDILRMVIERLEILSFRNGTLQENAKKFDNAKEKITKI